MLFGLCVACGALPSVQIEPAHASPQSEANEVAQANEAARSPPPEADSPESETAEAPLSAAEVLTALEADRLRIAEQYRENRVREARSCASRSPSRYEGEPSGDSGGAYLRYDGDGLLTRLSWDSDVLGAGGTEHYRYDRRRKLVEVRYEASEDAPVFRGTVRYQTRSRDGRVHRTLTHEGRERSREVYEYDALGRTISQTQIGAEVDDRRVTCEYDAEGRPLRWRSVRLAEDGSVEEARQRTTTYRYEGERLVAVGSRRVWEIPHGFVVDGGPGESEADYEHDVYTGDCTSHFFDLCAPLNAPPAPSGPVVHLPPITLGRSTTQPANDD